MSDVFIERTLPNGLRVVIEQMPEVHSAAAGILVRTGSRDEARNLAGVSHFLEHMCFKGTANRTAAQLNRDFDAMAGHPNAFTSHERTFYHGWGRCEDVGRQIELLADMMRSTLPAEEFDREKKVVLEEIAMSSDSIEHVAFDFIMERVFAGSSFGWPVLGYEDTVSALTRDQMAAYLDERYTPQNMVLHVAGNVEVGAVLEAAEAHCGQWPANDYRRTSATATAARGTAIKRTDRFNQQIVALCFAVPGAADAGLETLQAAAAILGGENSRYYWNIVQAGICPQADAWPLVYADGGLLILSGQCTPEKAERLTDQLRTEARRMCTNPVDATELQRVKNKRRTALAVEGEAPHRRLMQTMDDVDHRGWPRTVEERLAAVNAVTVDGIAEYLARYPIDDGGYMISVGPRDWPANS